jgi:hypothetical protein
MSRLFGILIGVALLISMGIGAAAHASEQLCLPGAEATSTLGHSDGDADQTRDSDSGYPHHHGGCHGHHVAAPVDAGSTAAPAILSSKLAAVGSTPIASAPPGQTLRPPIA